MDPKSPYTTDVAFSPSVKAIQSLRGSRVMNARMEERGSWPDTVTPDLAQFIAAQRSVFLATASADGQPYVQHRGGPPGFLRVLDDKTIAIADLAGNRQYISTGNLAENPKAQLFLIDFAHAHRVKIWGTARMVEPTERLLATLMPGYGKARAERVLLFHVTAWSANCPQYIPQRFEAADVEQALATRDARIAELEAEIERLRRISGQSSVSALLQG